MFEDLDDSIFKMFRPFSLLEYELRGFKWVPQPRDILGAFGSLQRFQHDGHLKKSQAPECKENNTRNFTWRFEVFHSLSVSVPMCFTTSFRSLVLASNSVVVRLHVHLFLG